MTTQTHQTILECLSQSQSDSLETQHRALQMLSSLTKVSPFNRTLLAQTHDSIPTLLHLSKSTLETQVLSLSILFNLSLNPDLKQFLANGDMIHLLNSIILAPSSSKSSKLAASLLCSLAMLDKNKARLGVAGTVQAIVKALSAKSSATHHLLSSLAELVQFRGNCTLAIRTGAVSTLFEVVEESDNEDLVGSSLSILGFLARSEEGMDAIKMRDGVVDTLVEVMKRRSMMGKEGLADILLRLFHESDEYAREAGRNLEFLSLLADLSIRGSSSAREKASLLMKKMMEANLDYATEDDSLIEELNGLYLERENSAF